MARRFSSNFPETQDAAVIKSIMSLSIHRHQPASFQCGVTDTLMGRVVCCLGGCRLFLGMTLDKVSTTFKEQFQRPPSSLKECASWVHRMSLELLLEDGFYCILREGDILVIPPFCVVLEGGLGVEHPCDLITWPCVLPGGHEWRAAFKEFQKLTLLDIPDQETDSPTARAILGITSSVVTVEKLLLLSDVKNETQPVRRKPLFLAFTLNSHIYMDF